MTIILGGTGTLGNAVVKHLGTGVTIFSRDELKQHQMKKVFPHCEYIVGDLRDERAVFNAIKGHQKVYLFGALKHVSTGEVNPTEVYKTNVGGCINTLNACQANGAELTFSSTDKCVFPINAYGASKMMAEKILLSQDKVPVRIARYGNVLGSRGSVLEMFVNSIKRGELVNVTDYECTRFWITIEEAANFVVTSKPGINIPNIKASKVVDLVNAVSVVLGKPATIKYTGLTRGEKLHESLSDNLHSNSCEQFSLDELVSIIRPIVGAFN